MYVYGHSHRKIYNISIGLHRHKHFEMVINFEDNLGFAGTRFCSSSLNTGLQPSWSKPNSLAPKQPPFPKSNSTMMSSPSTAGIHFAQNLKQTETDAFASASDGPRHRLPTLLYHLPYALLLDPQTSPTPKFSRSALLPHCKNTMFIMVVSVMDPTMR
jgi:hypothetical protein